MDIHASINTKHLYIHVHMYTHEDQSEIIHTVHTFHNRHSLASVDAIRSNGMPVQIPNCLHLNQTQRLTFREGK